LSEITQKNVGYLAKKFQAQNISLCDPLFEIKLQQKAKDTTIVMWLVLFVSMIWLDLITEIMQMSKMDFDNTWFLVN